MTTWLVDRAATCGGLCWSQWAWQPAWHCKFEPSLPTETRGCKVRALSVNNLSKKRQVKLLEVENIIGYRLGNRGSFRDGDRYFIAPSRLERGPPRTLARGLKGFHPGRKRGQSISWPIKTTVVQRLKFLELYFHPLLGPDRVVANFTSFVVCDLYASRNIWNTAYYWNVGYRATFCGICLLCIN